MVKKIVKPVKKKSKPKLAEPTAPFAMPVATPATRPVAQPVAKAKVLKPMKIVVDLSQLIRHGFVSEINVTGNAGNYIASVHLEVNGGMDIIGQGKNIVQAVEGLNKEVVNLNFEL